ncbi:unnamed protein product [Ilex paraguariensis]|uniref:Uncharacterized protein n=1 Tax=Ilex paraguariensis TaxID=185542 RepID=A0ABC8UNH3_9AQUA
MEDQSRRARHEHDLNLASRKAEEAALRRFQATHWLECLVGPLGISSQPSEKEFLSCLRSGLILCNAINKIQPGIVPKVVEIHSPTQSLTWESQPLPAYQYFENVRNFLVAVEVLKLPAFEASDLERDNLEAGSSAKVVDCILSLKAYHEWKQMSGGTGIFKPPKSPLVLNSASRIHSRASAPILLDPCRRLDMSSGCDKQQSSESDTQQLEGFLSDLIVKAIVEFMVDTKENIDDNILTSFRNGNRDPIKLFNTIFSSCLEEEFQNKFPGLKSVLKDGHSLSPFENLSITGNSKNLKALWTRTKKDFEVLQSQLQSDLKQLESQVQELSVAALGYHKVVKENRNLYNMVQDLKGNIRVYCRIRPAFNSEAKNVIDFTGEDGSVVVSDPLKPHKDGRKVFQFNRVFGPIATQDEVFKDTQPLIRSVMDGYNVCIFAYGQTGSGKTHTMCGPSGGSRKELGINYLALNDLFLLSNRRKDITNKLEIRSCTGDDGLSVPQATMHPVKSTADVLHLMKLGEVNRAVSSTAINDQSSRSHSILTVHIHGKDVSGSALRSCLHLVDLAGSERVDKSEVTGDALKEAQYINKSLSCLGDVITALAQKSSYIPYRNSKLTLLLQTSLGGNAKTLMFAHVSPEREYLGETISTLKFAQRVSTIELGAACTNKESREVMQLKEQIDSLKKVLANREARIQLNKPMETARTPFDKNKAMTERTPPRPRRLSIENCSTVNMEKSITFETKKGSKTPSVKTRSRRLSLEGPRYANKDAEQIKILESTRKPLQSETAWLQESGQLQDAEAVTKPYGHICNGESMVNLCCQRAPRSPTSSAYQSLVVKTDSRTKIPSLQLPRTPEPPVLARNEGKTGMQGEHTTSSESQTPGFTNSTNGKGSQIRKSLRTIGKLINGSEKRNQQKLTEALSPVNGTSNINFVKLSAPSNPRALRRQSLTGIQPSDSSRRSSLGGNPTPSCGNENRNAKTPPPVHPSAKSMKRWQ